MVQSKLIVLPLHPSGEQRPPYSVSWDDFEHSDPIPAANEKLYDYRVSAAFSVTLLS